MAKVHHTIQRIDRDTLDHSVLQDEMFDTVTKIVSGGLAIHTSISTYRGKGILAYTITDEGQDYETILVYETARRFDMYALLLDQTQRVVEDNSHHMGCC